MAARRETWIYYGLLLAVVVGLVLHVVNAFSTEYLLADDGISYLAAAGSLEKFGEDPASPFDRWAAASEWQALIQPHASLSLSQISSGLAITSVHPPLYFWLLGIWNRLFGISVRGGMILNIIVELLLVLAIWRFLMTVTKNRLIALATLTVWLMSPVSAYTLQSQRPYVLFALWTVLLAHEAYVHIYVVERFHWSWRTFAMVAVIGAAGLLTHFYFALVIFFIGVAILLRHLSGGWQRIMFYAASTVGMAVLFVLCFSEVSMMVGSTTRDRSVFTFAELIHVRIPQVLAVASLVFTDVRLPVNLLVLAGAILLVLIALIRRVKSLTPSTMLSGLWHVMMTYPLAAFILILAGGYTVSLLALYTTFFVPDYAFAIRYLSPVWPFGAWLLVSLLGYADGQWRATRSVLALCSLMLLSLCLLTISEVSRGDETIETQHQVVIDNQMRGVVVPLIMKLQPNDQVFISSQQVLLADPSAWLPQVQTQPTTYIAVIRGADSTEQEQAEIMALLRREGFDLRLIGTGPWDAEFYDLAPSS